MFEVFEQYIKNTTPDLSKEEVNRIRAACITKKLRRKEMLLREGDTSHWKIFVAKGLLRNYSVAENGHEYIVRFTDAEGWTADPESYATGLPSKYNIDAIEPSEVLMWSREDFEILKETTPALTAFSERVMTNNAGLIQRRVLMNISASAEEKYIDFINTYPNIFHRVPLHMVASYLGVSRETLTRIRQGLTVSKV